MSSVANGRARSQRLGHRTGPGSRSAISVAHYHCELCYPLNPDPKPPLTRALLQLNDHRVV